MPGSEADIAWLRDLVTSSDVVRERGWSYRPYQAEIASGAYRALSHGRNAGVTLPTGAGKTFVADQVAALWIRDRPTSRVVSVVPRRVLVDQHATHAGWLRDELTVGRLRSTDGWGPRRRAMGRANLLVTTPGLMTSGTQTLSFKESDVAAIGLLILDELDFYLSARQSDGGVVARPHEALASILETFPGVRFLLLTATPPTRTNHSEVATAKSEYVASTFGVRNWKRAEPSAIQAFLPAADVKWVAVEDSRVRLLDAAIADEIRIVIDGLREHYGFTLDEDWIREKAAAIASSSVRIVPTVGGLRIRVDEPIRRAARALSWRYRQRILVFEDDARGYSVRDSEYWFLTSDGQRFPAAVLRLDSPDGQHDADLGEKCQQLLTLLAAQPDDRGLIFVRFLRVARALERELRPLDRSVQMLHGELNDVQRASAVDRFRQESGSVMIIVRETGGRGLDLPEADFAVFYSPKGDSDSTWQEVSRIRATARCRKPTYVAFYKDTAEEQKAARLSAMMALEEERFWQDGVLPRPS